MIGTILKPELEDLIERREFTRLREVLCEFRAAEIAEILVDLGATERAVLLRILPAQLAADVFEYLSHEDQEELLRSLGDEAVIRLLNEMEPDDRTAILEELPASMTQKILALLSPEERKTAVSLLGYPEDSIGRWMTPEYIAIQEEWTVAEVLSHLRKMGRERETLHNLFVVDANQKLVGVLSLRSLVTAELASPVKDLVERQFIALKDTDDQETAVATFKKYDRTSLPVVNSNGVLVGLVTVDDVLDLAEEETTEDIHKAGGVTPLTTSFLKTRFRVLYGRRVSWLVLLVFINIFSGAGIAYFEELIASVVALVFFLPLLIDCGGNSGSQAATLVIRSLALGEIKIADYLRVLWREIAVALALGLTMAGAVFLLAWWRAGIPVALAVSISMVIIVFIGSLTGMSLPFVLHKLKMDPAAASAPLVTSLADISGVLIYLSIARALLGVLAPT
ncbi:MAG: magnesium transporter [Verrucomicrobia bacterium]|nr:magnesium transporter [Verrucomicrobiota bacterium]